MDLIRQIVTDYTTSDDSLNRADCEDRRFAPDSSAFEAAHVHEQMRRHRDGARRADFAQKFLEGNGVEGAIRTLIEIEIANEEVPLPLIEAEGANLCVVPLVDVISREWSEASGGGEIVGFQLCQNVAPKIVVKNETWVKLGVLQVMRMAVGLSDGGRGFSLEVVGDAHRRADSNGSNKTNNNTARLSLSLSRRDGRRRSVPLSAYRVLVAVATVVEESWRFVRQGNRSSRS